MKRNILYTIFFLVISLHVSGQFLQQNYQMKGKSISAGSYSLFHFKSPGATTGFQFKYAWLNGIEGVSGLSVGFTFPKSMSDTFTAFNTTPGSLPASVFSTVDYHFSQFNFQYHYNYYILETQYDDALAFYISGSSGIILYNYGRVTQIDRNRFKSDYQYKSAGYSIMGSVSWGTHYQFGDNMRVVGETGPFLYKEKELKLRGEPIDWRMGWGLMLGIEFGF